ncbi:MAG: outer membrane protein assembly factor BamA [Cocleimonas sp.]|nr:outer membrane protein assembly factor BamA [Cocleimonas sp.]
MIKKTLQLSVASCLLAASQSTLAASFVLQDIEIKGLERVAAGTVLSNLPVAVGDQYDDRMSAKMVSTLYKTGLFEDINLSKRGNILVVNVKERSAVGEINLSGNHIIESKAILEALKRAGVAKGRPLNKAALARIQKEIKQQYLARGNYAADVKTDLKPLARNRLAVNIKIKEGKVARIKKVRISGNKAFPESTLKALLETGVPGSLSFFSNRDKYSKQKLVGDLDKLTAFYKDRGYLHFEVASTQVSLSKDKRSVFVNINLHEGDQYRVGKIDVASNSAVPQQKLRRLVHMKQGQVFSQQALEKTRKDLKSQVGKQGFAFSKLRITPQIDEVKKAVNLSFQLDKGQRTYVRRINIRGNYRSKDEVFRREMRQLESSWFSKEKVARSKIRIQRLPFIESVNITTSPVAGTRDQIDLDVTVKERSSNQFTAGVGYSENDGLLFNVGLSQNNFMGSGKSLSIAAENSASSKNLRISYNNPYHTVDGIGRGFNIFYNKTNADEADISDYQSDAYGVDVNYTIPLSEDDSLRFSIGGEHREIKISETSTPDHIKQFVIDHGKTYNQLLGTLSYIHDTRNRSLFPSKGQRQSLAVEIGFPGSDLQFYKLKYRGRLYQPITDDITFAVKGRVSYGKGMGDSKQLPFYENFYAGGIGSVRGFDHNSLGPRDSNDTPKGGNLSTTVTAEVQFPVPFLADVKGLRASAFVDGGNVFDDKFDADEMRYSAGLSMTWMTPLGAPLTVSYSKPFNAKDDDETSQVQFSLGATF